jgi:hypothetical protein
MHKTGEPASRWAIITEWQGALTVVWRDPPRRIDSAAIRAMVGSLRQVEPVNRLPMLAPLKPSSVRGRDGMAHA